MGRSRLTLLAALSIMGLAIASPAQAATPTTAQLVGQRLVIAFPGTKANGWLLARIRAGQIGGVLLFSSNVSSPAQLTALTASLQAAARAGGQPRLLITTDQEGGEVKRIPWAPPNRSARQLGALPASASLASGTGTGQALRHVGINVNLAPVADVPTGPASFIEQQQRAFSTSRFVVANDAAAFARGLENGKVWPTYKHFPGLGRATVSTDQAPVTITASQATLEQALLPYRIAFQRGLNPIVMLSSAVYSSFGRQPAAWSPSIIRGLLRGRMGFTGATITDSLDAAAATRRLPINTVTLRSANAGADMLLITGSQAESQGAYQALLKAAGAGTLPRSQLQASYARIIALKSRLP
jgi:beta-N-acetylhexosaminidase